MRGSEDEVDIREKLIKMEPEELRVILGDIENGIQL